MEYFLALLEHKDIITNNKDLLWCIVLALVVFYYANKNSTCHHHNDVCGKIEDIEDNYMFVEECMRYLMRHMYSVCHELNLKPDKEPTHQRNRRDK